MDSPVPLPDADQRFLDRMTAISGEPFKTCMQCGTCSVVCPMTENMQLTTRQVMHLIQWGQVEFALAANTPWVCASCHSCEVRCPRGIDIPRVMEALRLLTLRTNRNHIQPFAVPQETLAEAPQVAMVSAFRKHTA
ncbi:MAG: 4Fe-4S dicluster domain-containing protein [Candidatus Krumholzibacteriia bacterium]